ncbi:TOPRIM nucleotidyl transferase/hydrolase domain-containing protein [Cellulomonas alba]|uniref:ATP-dependent endonuclease n=1 Tax=Cellulomonas alba TaxID=3053467 RepID=A0ABT7SCE3_9CELL|nr:TOPRIM nucleotidyl transferase/hydrolase domain-containing protein [Cellulomonas alba]MDM7853853.1 ATP-dependent endonuclease [Cellulomonas alba]
MSDRRAVAAELAAAGYESGPGAAVLATARASTRIGAATVVLLVEGISDQAAVEAAALGRGRDLRAERVVVVPVGGAHAAGRFLRAVGPLDPGTLVLGLCDAPEADVFRRGLDGARTGAPAHGTPAPGTSSEGPVDALFVCTPDLEGELIRALGPALVEACLAEQGDLAAFRSLQGQPAWRDRPVDAQLRRFLGSGARRKTRYARVLVAAATRDARLPAPLDRILDAARPA